MRFWIDDKEFTASPGASLLDVLKDNGFSFRSVRTRPLAARIGGETIGLEYAPHENDKIYLLYYGQEEGRRVYERSLLMVLLEAVARVLPGARTQVKHSMGGGLYLTLDKEEPLLDCEVAQLKQEMRRIVAEDTPFVYQRLDVGKAITLFSALGQRDKVRLLAWRRYEYFDVYRLGDSVDYFYGKMVPSASFVNVFSLRLAQPGLMLMLPDRDHPHRAAKHQQSPKLMRVFDESDRWSRVLECATVADLNDMIRQGGMRDFVRISEALHEKSMATLAGRIMESGARAVMVSGPSSSGKTTTANRLSVQLRVLGLRPVMLSLDNFYKDHHLIPADQDGKKDLEHIHTLDIQRLNEDLESLLDGHAVELPVFNFVTGLREKRGIPLRLQPDQPLIIEGIHALNPIITGQLPRDLLFKLYVSALTTLNLDDHNRIHTTDVRLLRRLVRDHATRGTTMEQTLQMWPSVRAGEREWIFPYQEQADAILNTSVPYELSVLKKYAFSLLQQIGHDSPVYAQAQAMLKFLNYFLEADVEAEIPPTSILREFIGGNSFYT